MPHPGRRPFYKYVAPNTALAILENQSIRYSSPLLFNDPFDHQIGLHLDFDLMQFPQKVVARLEYLASNPHIPLRHDAGSMGLALKIMRGNFSTHGFPRGAFLREVLPIISEGAQIIESTRAAFEAHWLDSLKAIRTFCVTEEKDNLLMWAHYAKDHTGAVLELWSLPEEDNALSVSEPVQYSSKPPAFFTEDIFIDYFCGVSDLDVRAHSRRSIYTKSDHWRYEKEWRVYYPQSSKPGLFEYNNLRKSELGAVYFGCKTDQSLIARISDLLAQNFPETKRFAAARENGAYALRFLEI